MSDPAAAAAAAAAAEAAAIQELVAIIPPINATRYLSSECSFVPHILRLLTAVAYACHRSCWACGVILRPPASI